ncbi:MAG: hypothetical protein Q7S22_07095 [Candidatus Micrarchaeota archaeon]|nr:hypothetical protein [Candidatus Micrarchaeota archaeon]
MRYTRTSRTTSVLPRNSVAPLTEGISERRFKIEVLDGKEFRISLNGYGDRNWSKMSDAEIIEFAKAYCREKRIKKSSELVRGPDRDSGLYSQLQKRKLVNKLFQRKDYDDVTVGDRSFKIPLDKYGRRNWQVMSNEEILEFAKAYCAEKGITKISELGIGSNKNSGLNHVLRRRHLVDKVFERKQFDEVVLDNKPFKLPLNAGGRRNWKVMTDAQIVEYARAYCAEKGITKISQLGKGKDSDQGLRFQLHTRKLISQIFERKDFEEVVLQGRTFKIPLDNKQKRNWKAMSNDKIVDYAKAYCAEKGITKSGELQNGSNEDSGLAAILQRRNLTDRVFSDIRADQEASALVDLGNALLNFGGRNS